MANAIGAGVAALQGLLANAGATWQDRVREGAYTSPSGTRIRFDFEDVARGFAKRAAIFSFPGVDGVYVQQNGNTHRRYPIRAFFWGPQHDLIATAFEAALLEDGIGKLQHPLYGTINVVPVGEIDRRDDLKTAANQTVIECTFWTTLGAVYPDAASDPQSEILAAIAGFDVAAAQQFGDVTDLASAVQRANLKSTIKKFLREVSAAMEGVSDSVASVRREFADIQSLVNFGIDVLIGQPLLLAQQVGNLIKAPGRALTGIQSRLDGYASFAARILTSFQGNPAGALTAGAVLSQRLTRTSNDFHASDLFAMQAVAGSVVSVVADPVDDDGTPVTGPQFKTRPEAIAAAEDVVQQLDAVRAWRDLGFRALELTGQVGAFQVDEGSSYQALQKAVGLTTGFLVQVSFSLAAERIITLDRPRTIIDLCAELYGAVDSRLDFLIASNDLTGEEILEVPRGARIRYYPGT